MSFFLERICHFEKTSTEYIFPLVYRGTTGKKVWVFATIRGLTDVDYRKAIENQASLAESQKALATLQDMKRIERVTKKASPTLEKTGGGWDAGRQLRR